MYRHPANPLNWPSALARGPIGGSWGPQDEQDSSAGVATAPSTRASPPLTLDRPAGERRGRASAPLPRCSRSCAERAHVGHPRRRCCPQSGRPVPTTSPPRSVIRTLPAARNVEERLRNLQTDRTRSAATRTRGRAPGTRTFSEGVANLFCRGDRPRRLHAEQDRTASSTSCARAASTPCRSSATSSRAAPNCCLSPPRPATGASRAGLRRGRVLAWRTRRRRPLPRVISNTTLPATAFSACRPRLTRSRPTWRPMVLDPCRRWRSSSAPAPPCRESPSSPASVIVYQAEATTAAADAVLPPTCWRNWHRPRLDARLLARGK